jgi:hypothetical protein
VIINGALAPPAVPKQAHDASPATVAPQSLRTILLERGRPGAMMLKTRSAISSVSIGGVISKVSSLVILHQSHSPNAQV